MYAFSIPLITYTDFIMNLDQGCPTQLHHWAKLSPFLKGPHNSALRIEVFTG